MTYRLRSFKGFSPLLLAFVGAASPSSSRKFLEKDGDHAIMHRVMSFLRRTKVIRAEVYGLNDALSLYGSNMIWEVCGDLSVATVSALWEPLHELDAGLWAEALKENNDEVCELRFEDATLSEWMDWLSEEAQEKEMDERVGRCAKKIADLTRAVDS